MRPTAVENRRRRLRELCALGLLASTIAASPVATAPPEVDLGRLFADAAAWHHGADALAAAIERVKALSASPWRSADELVATLRAKDEVHRSAAEVDGYLGLREAFDATDEMAATLRPRMAALATRWEGEALPAFEAAVAALEAATLERWLAAEPSLRPYRWSLGAGQRAAPRRLEPRERELLGLIDVERRGTRQLHTALTLLEAPEVEVGLASGERLAITPALARNLSAEIADPVDRRRAQSAWREALGRRAPSLSALLAGVVRREASDARQRGFASPVAAALAEEAIPEEVVARLVEGARAAGPAVGRIHAARRTLLAVERYGTADIRVPVAGLRTDWTWVEARAAIELAAAGLGDEIGRVTARAFREGWIDAVERPRKRPSGFSTYVYRDHPYVSVVFRGATADLFRLAHEVGHAVHHQLAFEAQPFAAARPSVLASETAAALFELALARQLGELASGAVAAATADFEVQTIFRTFVGTALDADFEIAVHALGGEHDGAKLGELYRERLVAFHGGALELEPADDHGWIETPHFFTAPFYMPRYGLSLAAAAALFERISSPDAVIRESAQRDLAALLRAGATDSPVELLARAGADLRRPETLAAVGRRLAGLADRLEPPRRSGAR